MGLFFLEWCLEVINPGTKDNWPGPIWTLRPWGAGMGLQFTDGIALLAALACRSAARQEQDERRYESAAVLLQGGLKLLQRMGKLPELRKGLEIDLDELLPYRILDLVSRDFGDQSSHQEGLNLLDSFVRKRGGIEGRKSLKEINGLGQSEFELFFQQIRD